MSLGLLSSMDSKVVPGVALATIVVSRSLWNVLFGVVGKLQFDNLGIDSGLLCGALHVDGG